MSMRLFHNGTIVTLDERSVVADAMLVEDGVVRAIGTREAVGPAAGGHVDEVDLRGRTVIPGLIDPHTHFSFSMLHPVMVDCGNPPHETLAAVLDSIRERAMRAPPGAWIRGDFYHASAVREGRNPTRGELDEVAPDNPVIVVDITYHSVYANGLALRRSGIDRSTPDPPGGVIDRDPSGEPTGTLLESAVDRPQLASWTATLDDQPDGGMALAAQDSRRHLDLGITAVGDALVLPRSAALYERAARAGALGVAVHAIHGGESFFARPEVREILGRQVAHGDRLWSGAMKMFMDTSYPSPAISRVANGGREDVGTLLYTRAEAEALAVEAARAGLDIVIHCGGNRAVDQALDVFESVRRLKGGDERLLRIEHMFIGGPGQARRLAELDVVVVTQPGIARDWGHLFESWRGGDGELTLFPVRSLLDAGVTVTASSDHPCGTLSPFSNMHGAVERMTRTGERIDAHEAVSREDALRMYTTSAARAIGREGHGALEAGRPATFAVLDRDPLSCSPDELAEARVEEAWVDGELVGGALLGR